MIAPEGSARGASPLGRYHNSFMMFPIVCTRPHINNYVMVIRGKVVCKTSIQVRDGPVESTEAREG